MKKKTIAIDFDGVIHKYSKGWYDGTIYDTPVLGVQSTLSRIKKAGFHILIYTTRASNRNIDGKVQHGQLKEVIEYLEKYNIPYDEVFIGDKPIFTAIIDDRAIRFNPNPPWYKTLFGLKNAWQICEDLLERYEILKPGEGEEPIPCLSSDIVIKRSNLN